jgi:hypothetical protein
MSNTLDDIKMDLRAGMSAWRLVLDEKNQEPGTRSTLWIIHDSGGRQLVKAFPSDWPKALYDDMLFRYMRMATFRALALSIQDYKQRRRPDARWDGPKIAV